VKISVAIIFIIFIISIGINFFVNLLYLDLNRRNLTNTDKRVSLKILNISLQKAIDIKDKKSILKCKKYYVLYLTLFYIDLFLIFILIINRLCF
jgi:hypothetical protein